jgi:hypothetical protein
MGSVSGAGKYSCGKEVTIEATANEGYSFTEWNDGNTKASRSVKVKTDTSFKATFKANTYKVALHKGEGKLESELSSYTYGKGATSPMRQERITPLTDGSTIPNSKERL